MSNMAEGFGRGTQEEFITFLGYALGSLDETQSHLFAAYDRGYLDKDGFAALFSEGTAIRKLTVAFIRAMILPRGGVRSLGKAPSWSSQVWEIYERVTGQPRPARFLTSELEGAREARNDDAPAKRVMPRLGRETGRFRMRIRILRHGIGLPAHASASSALVFVFRIGSAGALPSRLGVSRNKNTPARGRGVCENGFAGLTSVGETNSSC